MPTVAGRTGRPWRQLRAAVLSASNRCHLCGEAIDLRLSGRHPDGPVIDHIVEIIDGGHPTDPANLAPAHRRCNQAKESRRRRRVAERGRASVNAGRAW